MGESRRRHRSAVGDTKQHATQTLTPSTKNLARRSATRPLTCANAPCTRSPGRRSFYPTPPRFLVWPVTLWSLVQAPAVQWIAVVPGICHLPNRKRTRHDLGARGRLGQGGRLDVAPQVGLGPASRGAMVRPRRSARTNSSRGMRRMPEANRRRPSQPGSPRSRPRARRRARSNARAWVIHKPRG